MQARKLAAALHTSNLSGCHPAKPPTPDHGSSTPQIARLGYGGTSLQLNVADELRGSLRKPARLRGATPTARRNRSNWNGQAPLIAAHHLQSRGGFQIQSQVLQLFI